MRHILSFDYRDILVANNHIIGIDMTTNRSFPGATLARKHEDPSISEHACSMKTEKTFLNEYPIEGQRQHYLNERRRIPDLLGQHDPEDIFVAPNLVKTILETHIAMRWIEVSQSQLNQDLVGRKRPCRSIKAALKNRQHGEFAVSNVFLKFEKNDSARMWKTYKKIMRTHWGMKLPTQWYGCSIELMRVAGFTLGLCNAAIFARVPKSALEMKSANALVRDNRPRITSGSLSCTGATIYHWPRHRPSVRTVSVHLSV